MMRALRARLSRWLFASGRAVAPPNVFVDDAPDPDEVAFPSVRLDDRARAMITPPAPHSAEVSTSEPALVGSLRERAARSRGR